MHYQLPGGHVDTSDLRSVTDGHLNCEKGGGGGRGGTPRRSSVSSENTLIYGCATAAARELFEETGIDVRSDVGRLVPMKLLYEYSESCSNSNNDGSDNVVFKKAVVYEHRLRWYFTLRLSNDDFPDESTTTSTSLAKHGNSASKETDTNHLNLQLSREHSGFTFQKDLVATSQILSQHSNGGPAEAILMALKVKDAMRERSLGGAYGSNLEYRVSSGVTDEDIKRLRKLEGKSGGKKEIIGDANDYSDDEESNDEVNQSLLTKESSDETPKTPLLTKPSDRVYGSNRTSKGKHNRRIAAGGNITDEEENLSDRSGNLASNKLKKKVGEGGCCFCFGLGAKESIHGIVKPK